MLIPSMTFYEMYEELIADRAKLAYKRQQLTPKAIKKMCIRDRIKRECPDADTSYSP